MEGRSDREPDVALLAQVAAGSHDALATLYDRHAIAIHALARRMTGDPLIAEEVVQETFLVLWNRAELFDAGIGSLSTWLHAIARNRTIDRLRSIGRRPLVVTLSGDGDDGMDATAQADRIVEAGTIVGGAAPGIGPEAAAEAAEARVAVDRALGEMPELERVVIELAYREELSQSEIASRLGWPLGTVKTRTRRALAHLREVLEPILADPRSAPDTAAAPASAPNDAPQRPPDPQRIAEDATR